MIDLRMHPVALALLLLLAPPPAAAAEAVCVTLGSIQSWQAVGLDQLQVTGEDGRRWRLVLQDDCPELAKAGPQQILLGSRDGRLCPFAGDALVVRGRPCIVARAVPLAADLQERDEALP